MPKIFTPESFSTEEREARKDFIDKHTPYIFCDTKAKKGVPFPIHLRVGKEHSHIDDFNHYISTITLYDKDFILAKIELGACIVSTEERRGNADVIITIVPNKSHYQLSAHCYCTKHGVWQGESVDVSVED